MFDIQEELKNLPADPGVYLMHDKHDTIIYVGKAKVLKNRVRQYFQNSAAHTPKVKAMVANIAYFEYIVTDSEMEALVLECNLIKKHMPKYNILLKDDKHYPYIKVTLNQDYPKVMMTRKLEKDGAKYFGPYMGVNTIRNTLEIVQKIFSPPTCNRKFPQDIGKGRPCLNYHIKNCFAPCTGKVSKEEYRQVFFDICAFLDGNHKQLLKTLEEEMKKASGNLEFEKAALLRDKIKSIQALEEKQKIIKADAQIDRDIIAFCTEEGRAFVEVFFIRGGKVIGRENYRLDEVEGLDEQEIMTDFVKQFYGDSVNVPEEIILQYDIFDRDIIAGWLRERRGRKVTVTVPQKGEKHKLVGMVLKNAEIARDNFKIRELKKARSHVVEELKKALSLEREPKRIEAYDISNISGSDNVAAMVVFEEGKPVNRKYRHFKIKTVEGADDYSSTQEVIYRRFRRALDEETAVNKGELLLVDAKFLPLPDLILADGGKGHVNAICEMLDQMEIDLPVFGMVKDDRHRTRALINREGNEIEMNPVGAVFHFITRVQDEVHRFAISYFRKTHGKSSVKSQLDEIPGIGAKRKKELLKKFGSVENIKNAEEAELKAVVDKRTAQNILEYFRQKEQ